jgi:hypothetical protein
MVIAYCVILEVERNGENPRLIPTLGPNSDSLYVGWLTLGRLFNLALPPYHLRKIGIK